VFGYFWIVKQVNVMSLWLVWLDTCVNLGADFIQQIKSTIFEWIQKYKTTYTAFYCILSGSYRP